MFFALTLGGLGLLLPCVSQAQFETGPVPKAKGGAMREVPSEDDPMHADPYAEYGAFREEDEEAEAKSFLSGKSAEAMAGKLVDKVMQPQLLNRPLMLMPGYWQ